MNLPLIRTFRLLPRGEGGLACDNSGVALGAAELVRFDADVTGRRRYNTIPSQAFGRVLNGAYGPPSEAVVLRLHGGLSRAAAALEAGDLCLAGIETVLLGLPDLTASALEKLAGIANLEEWGTGWQDQPLVPAGQAGGGQWTTGDTGGSPGAEDGVYRPEGDDARVTLAGGVEEEEPSRRSNAPPDDYTRLEDVFPGLRDTPGLGVPLAPVDGFFGVSALAEEANLEATLIQYRRLVADTKRVDPSFVDQELLPPDGIAGLS